MIYAFIAYFFWGFFPIYWKLLKHVSAPEILAHRVLWAFIFYTIVSSVYKKRLSFFVPKSKKIFFLLSLAGGLLMVNWLVYIRAVNSNQIVESSLGYFITPLVNIFLGVVILKEKLNRHQVISSIIAAAGVIVISIDQGHLPWIALILGLTFSVYGLVKKISSNSATGTETNQFESMIFAPLALIFILYQFLNSVPSWVNHPTIPMIQTIFLLAGAGIITGFPLVLFAEALKRVPYFLMGFFQFLAPTLQFVTGVLIFNEALSKNKLIGFGIIWFGILYLIISGFIINRRKARL
jgi:chloramphenicol-sensitive protein RarD